MTPNDVFAVNRAREKGASPDPRLEPCSEDMLRQFAAARAGSSVARGELLESCRNYLLLIANVAVKHGLRAKIGASDLVQETFVTAHQQFHRFEGESIQELLRWLSQILEFRIGNTLRYYYSAARRNVDREMDLQQLRECFGGDSQVDGDFPNPCGATLSAEVGANEDRVRFQHALQSLMGDQQEVIRLRIDEDLTFEEIGLRMNRSADAARKLFTRAVSRLQSTCGEGYDGRK